MKDKLNTWLRRYLLGEEDEERGKVTKLILRHAGGSKNGDIISINVSKRKTDDLLIDELISEIEANAHNDAEGLGGMQKYVVVMLCKNTGDKPVSRHTFRLQGNDEEGGEGNEFESEPASVKGMVSQLMRHNEAISRTLVLATGQAFSNMQRITSRLSDQVDTLLQARAEMVHEYEAVLLAKSEKQLQLVSAEASERRKDEGFAMFKPLVPVIMGKIMGNKLVGNAIPPELLQINAFVESLTEDQFGGFMNLCNDGQKIALITMIQNIKEAQEKANKASEAAKNGKAH